MSAQVPSLEPHLIPNPVFWRIFVFYPRLLRFDHEFLGVALCLLELLQSFGNLRYRGWLIAPISAGVIAHHEKEGGLPCSLVHPVIVREFHQREQRHPVILPLVGPEPKILFQPLIGSFQLSICSGVIRG